MKSRNLIIDNLLVFNIHEWTQVENLDQISRYAVVKQSLNR